MLQNSYFRFSVILAIALFINIAVASAQVNNQNSEIITIVEDDDDIMPSVEDQVKWVDLENVDYVNVEPEGEKVYEIVDEQPEFPGGNAAILEFIRSNVKYPPIAKKNEIEGRVIVQFIVERDGSLADVKVVKTLQEALDIEAKRLVSIMPDWKPGIKDGEPVRVRYSLPINFRLDEMVKESGSERKERIERMSFTSLFLNIHGNEREMASPQVVNDPADETNKCISLITNRAPKSRGESQLLLYCKRPFEIGDTVFFSIKIKGRAKQKFTTELQSTPGSYLYSPSGSSDVDVNWLQYTLKFLINNSGTQTIALNMADLNEGNVCYFDDMKIEAHHVGRDWVSEPEFPGGIQAMKDYLKQNNKYPSPSRGKSVYVDVSFQVESDGTIHNPVADTGLDESLEAEAVRLVSEMPVWNPARRNGEPVGYNISIPIEFDNTNAPSERKEDVYLVVESAPEFPGGTEALLAFLRKNVRYPAICRENNIQGRVLVTFVVNKNGEIVAPEVVKSVHPQLDMEALRVISIMPNWIPGTQKGKPVRVKYTVPINFRLN